MDTNIVTAPVVSKFKIYGITKGQVKVLFPQELSITFYNDHHTNSSIATLGNVKAEDLVTSTTTDSFFTSLLEDLKRYEWYSRFDNTNHGTDIFSLKILHKDEDKIDNGFDSVHVKTLNDSLNAIDTTYSIVGGNIDTIIQYHPLKDPYYMYSVGDTIHVGTSEKSIVHASAQNAKVFLANRLVHKVDTNYTFPTLDTSGNPLRIIPPVGPALDDYFGVFSNISGLLEVLADLKGVNLLKKNEPDDQAMLNLSAYLNSVVGSKDVAGLNPSSFSHLVLWYTDYLLYAGLCSYIDNDFFSRYFNFHNLLLDELKALIEFVAPEFNNNNIIIRYYAVAALYDMMLGQDRGYLQTFTEKLDAFVNDSTGEYGEGYAYLNYVSDIALPVIYVGMQETYLYGPKTGQPWLPDTSKLVRLYRAVARNLIGAANRWGEIPALDDGSPTIPYLAPFSVITGEAKYVQSTKDVWSQIEAGVYNNLESAERVGIAGNSPWKMFLYPYNRTFSGSTSWQNSLDSVRQIGSIVQIPAGNDTNILNMTIIAEEDPSTGGTHDQIDHGAIQFVRYKNNAAGTAPHVDHLIIDPGYPGFQDNKRFINEWKYCNQNVQMLWDSGTVQISGENGAQEFYGYKEGVDFETVEKFNYKENGGMTGYRYVSPDVIRDVLHKYVLRNSGLQDNKWGIVDHVALQQVPNKTLSPLSGQGKSQVIARYKNGVEVRIDYKYPKTQSITSSTKNYGIIKGTYYYGSSIDYEESHHGIRGIYTLGNNYFVIDHLPESDLPSSAVLAASWNMPKNTTQLGTSGWQRFVFTAITPDSNTFIDPSNPTSGKFRPESRIEIAVAGAANVVSDTILFQTTQDSKDTISTNHLTFENKINICEFMVTQFRVADISETIPAILEQQENRTTVSGGVIWRRTYNDNSQDVIVYNPLQQTDTVEGITSNAKVWLLHADNTGNWLIGNLYGTSSTPAFPGFTSTPTVNTYGTSGTGLQYEIIF